MTLRYKKHPELIFQSYTLNPVGLGEVLTGDDSAFFSELECLLSSGEWKCLKQAFHDRDVITDNYHQHFREAKNEEERKRGYYE